MGKPTGFLDYTRVNCPSRDAAARTGDYAPVKLPLSERNRRRQSGRCMDCGVPFCQAGASFEGVLQHMAVVIRNDLFEIRKPLVEVFENGAALF